MKNRSLVPHTPTLTLTHTHTPPDPCCCTARLCQREPDTGNEHCTYTHATITTTILSPDSVTESETAGVAISRKHTSQSLPPHGTIYSFLTEYTKSFQFHFLPNMVLFLFLHLQFHIQQQSGKLLSNLGGKLTGGREEGTAVFAFSLSHFALPLPRIWRISCPKSYCFQPPCLFPTPKSRD